MAVVVKFLAKVTRYGEGGSRQRFYVDIAGIILLVAIGAFLYHASRVTTEAAYRGQQAHDYLCYQKFVGIPNQIRLANVKIDRSLKYETDVQLGYRKPIPGITQADIARGISDSQSDINRLKDTLNHGLSKVHCP